MYCLTNQSLELNQFLQGVIFYENLPFNLKKTVTYNMFQRHICPHSQIVSVLKFILDKQKGILKSEQKNITET